MADIIEKVLTDPLFIKIGIVVAILIALSIFKKLFKVLLTLVVLFFLYIGYLVLSGEDPVEAMDKTIEELKDVDMEKVRKKVEKEVEKTAKELDKVSKDLKKKVDESIN